MSTPGPADVLGQITLISGSEEFLAERTVDAVRAAVRAHDPEAEYSQTNADQLTMAALGDLAAPSLFSSTRCVVVRRLEDLPEESVPGLLDYAGAPAEDVALVLVHSGGQRGSGLLTKLRKVAAVHEVKVAAPKPRELPAFVAAETRSHGGRIAQDAAEHLVAAVGQDLRGLAAAASQLASDFDKAPITLAMVRQYFGGRAEAKSFTIADATLAGQTERALEELRWALDTGTPPVLVTSAVAGSLRSVARFQGTGRGLRDAELARELGVPPWKVGEVRRLSRSWDPDGLSRAIRAVARTDADVKGQAGDPAWSLEKMVLDVVSARR